MKSWTEQERIAIVAGWSSSTDDQVAYARSAGISPRTLRGWVERYGSGPRPIARAKAIIERALEQLRALHLALDAEEAVGAECNEEVRGDAMPDRHGEPAGRDVRLDVASGARAERHAPPPVDLDVMIREVHAEVACQAAPPPELVETEPITPKPMPPAGASWW